MVNCESIKKISGESRCVCGRKILCCVTSLFDCVCLKESKDLDSMKVEQSKNSLHAHKENNKRRTTIATSQNKVFFHAYGGEKAIEKMDMEEFVAHVE